ncbi:fluoride efflux transporter CrcB [Actinoplanes couchii]|uniref:Fluoride-specific ion channel FluC n=1 Tax=Actinoplanes couchii TaxID=403638 RepID=A0ABQ3XQ29_9ACTN|nr:putative fluoride ion transporter CrcB [Actinoplanes couchii]
MDAATSPRPPNFCWDTVRVVDRTALAVVSAGGVLGALTRWAISVTWPGTVWTTWAINVSGCFLIGVLYTRVERRIPRLLIGTGFLGGYTTFSTAMVEVSVAGLVYLAATLTGCLLAVLAGSLLARR